MEDFVPDFVVLFFFVFFVFHSLLLGKFVRACKPVKSINIWQVLKFVWLNLYLYLRDRKVSSHESWLKLTFIFIIHITESVYWKNIWQIISKFVWLVYCNHCRFQQLIWKIGLDRASIVGKLKPTAALLEWPTEEYSGAIENKIRTLTFST